MSCLTRLVFRAAAGKAGVSLRTLEYWRAQGMTVEMRGGRLFVQLEHVLAWKRWKSLNNSARMRRREAAARRGIVGAVVSPCEYERARRDWVAAGGKELGDVDRV